jgi:DNA topoisomerase-1
MVSVIQSKGYVTLQQKRLVPTETGAKLCDFLVEHFPQVLDMGYTAQLEADLDRVASGELPQQVLLSDFWQAFQPQLQAATGHALAQVRARPTHKPLLLHPAQE